MLHLGLFPVSTQEEREYGKRQQARPASISGPRLPQKHPTQVRTFETKRDAEDWAALVESEMRRGLFIDQSEAERTTFVEILGCYFRIVTPDKRGWCDPLPYRRII